MKDHLNFQGQLGWLFVLVKRKNQQITWEEGKTKVKDKLGPKEE